MAAYVLLMGALLPAGGGGGRPSRRVFLGKGDVPVYARANQLRRGMADRSIWHSVGESGRRPVCHSVAASAPAYLFQSAGQPDGAGRTVATVRNGLYGNAAASGIRISAGTLSR